MTQKPNYKCTQQQLYAVARLAWNNYLENLPAFTAHKGKYNEDFAVTALAALDAAEALPEDQARTAPTEIAYINLRKLALICLQNWQALKQYIIEAYPDARKPMLEEAGSRYYRKASKYGWEQMKSLLTNGYRFITTHTADLSISDKNMPATFKNQFATAKKNWQTQYTAFLHSQQTSPQGTQSKVAANNAISKTLAAMLLDGKFIFRNDPPKRNCLPSAISSVSSPPPVPPVSVSNS